jgi:hypothetical protein
VMIWDHPAPIDAQRAVLGMDAEELCCCPTQAVTRQRRALQKIHSIE